MSKRALAAAGGKVPSLMRAGISVLDDLRDGGLAAGLLAGAGGNKYYCDPTNGTSGGDALSAEKANSDLLTVYNLTTANQNDIVYFIGLATSYKPSAAFVWSKNYTHLVGLTNSLPGMGQRARIVNDATNDLAILFTLSGSGCLIANIQFYDGKDNAVDGACVLVSGERNHLVNCFFAGMGSLAGSAPATRAGSYSLKVSGDENTVSGGTIGLDTVIRSAENHELVVSGIRNRFVDLEIRSHSVTSGKFLVKIEASGDIRDVQFENVLFFNHSENWASGINNAFDMTAASGTHFVLLRGDCLFVGVGLGVATAVTRIYGAGPAVNSGMFIGANPST